MRLLFVGLALFASGCVCGSAPIAPLAQAPRGMAITSVAADESTVFVTASLFDPADRLFHGGMFAVAKDGGSLNALSADDGYPLGAHVYGDEVYWFSQPPDGGAQVSLRSVPKAGGPSRTVLTGENIWGGIDLFEARLFWASQGGPGATGPDGDGGPFNCYGSGVIRTRPLDGGAIETLTSPGQFPATLTQIWTSPVVDSSGIYFIGELGNSIDTMSAADAGIGVHLLGCFDTQDYLLHVAFDGGVSTVLALAGEFDFFTDPVIAGESIAFFAAGDAGERVLFAVPKDNVLASFASNPALRVLSRRPGLSRPVLRADSTLTAAMVTDAGTAAAVIISLDGSPDEQFDLGVVMPGVPFVGDDGDVYSLQAGDLYRVPFSR